jgi:hypothetical protein
MKKTSTRTLFSESVPIATILLFWGVLAAIVPVSAVATGMQAAGFLMALLYVVAKGRTLATGVPETTHEPDVASVLGENLRVAVGAGSWFALAIGIWFLTIPFTGGLDVAWAPSGLGYAIGELANLLTGVFAGTGVFTVGLYVTAVVAADSQATVDTGTTTTHTGSD